MSTRTATPLLAYTVMAIAPLFFASNMIFGRFTVPEVAPFTLAFVRWSICALVLAPFVAGAGEAVRRSAREAGRLLFVLGFLGMWVCGAGVYYALRFTSATNGTLIYTTSPLFIILIERIFRGRPIRLRELAGMVLAFAGIIVIVVKGSLAALLALDFNIGDLIFLVAAIAWAGYSVLMRSASVSRIPALALFGLVAAAGSLALAPFSALEYLAGDKMPVTAHAWLGIAGLVIFASLLAFSAFQYGIRVLGAPLAGVFMYLLPPYGVLLAVALLGETFHAYHAVGIVMVLTGIIMATAPLEAIRRLVGRR